MCPNYEHDSHDELVFIEYDTSYTVEKHKKFYLTQYPIEHRFVFRYKCGMSEHYIGFLKEPLPLIILWEDVLSQASMQVDSINECKEFEIGKNKFRLSSVVYGEEILNV